jgi:aldehyde dehydrogenase (NAD+)
VRRAGEKAKNRKVGHPFADTTDQGPQVSQEQMDRVLHYISKGKSEGAKLVTGGNRIGKQVS